MALKTTFPDTSKIFPDPFSTKVKGPTKTELKKLQEQRQEEQLQSEINFVVQSIQSNPDWANGSIEQKEQYLKSLETNVWPTFAKDNFGQDTATANIFKNNMLAPLRQQVKQERDNVSGVVPYLYNLGQSTMRGIDTAYDAAAYGIPLGLDVVENNLYTSKIKEYNTYKQQALDDPTLTDEQRSKAIVMYDDFIKSFEDAQLKNREEIATNIQDLRKGVDKSTQNELSRQAANPRRANIKKREQELAQDPNNIVLWEQIKEGNIAEPLLNLAAEQLPNVAVIGGSSLLGSLASPIGAGVGAAVSGSAVTAGQNATELANEIQQAPLSILETLPIYKELKDQGLSEQQIRDTITQNAIAEAFPIWAGIGAVSGLVGPEALIARSSILSPLLRGGIGRRVLTGSALSAVEEAATEGLEQTVQNVAWNAATGDQRSLLEGVPQAAFTGGAVGGLLGGVGGISQGPIETSANASNESVQQTISGNLNLPQTNPEGLLTEMGLSGVVSENDAQRMATATEQYLLADNLIQDMVGKKTIPTPQNLNNIFEALYNAEQNGVEKSNIEQTLAQFQANANIPIDNNLNLIDTYNNYIETSTKIITTNLNNELKSIQEQINNLRNVENTTGTYNLQPEINKLLNREATIVSTLNNLATGNIQNEQFRQTTQSGTEGINSASAPTNSQPTTGQQRVIAETISGGLEGTVGDSSTTQSPGVGGAAYEVPGTIAGNLYNGQQMGGPSGDGTYSGSNSGATSVTSSGTDIGNGGVTGTAIQRTGDGGRAETTSGITQPFSEISVAERVDNFIRDWKDYGLDEVTARAYAEQWVRGMDALTNMDPDVAYTISNDYAANQVNAYIRNIDDALISEPDNIYSMASEEAIQSDSDMYTAFAELNNLTPEQELAIYYGIFSPEVSFQLDPTRNGLFVQDTSFYTGGEPEFTIEPTQLTDAESAEVVANLATELNEALAEDSTEIIGDVIEENGTNVITESPELPAALSEEINSIVDNIDRRAETFSEATIVGANYRDYLRSKFRSTTYGPQYTAGKWMRLATWVRRSYVDGEADLRTWLIRNLPTVDINFDQSPVTQALQVTRNRIAGARNMLAESAVNPFCETARTIADETGIDVEMVKNDLGTVATLIHTIEVEPMFRAGLEEDLQNAIAMPSGEDKARAVRQAQSALNKYDAYQKNIDAEKVPVFGGRRLEECQTMLQELRAKYGDDIIIEGRQLLGDGFDTITTSLIGHGQIDKASVDSWPKHKYYVALTVDKQAAEGASNDLQYYMPRSNYHRYGSMEPAQNAYKALIQYASRAAMNIGLSEFGTYMNETYLTLEAGGNTDGLQRYNMAQLYAQIDNAITPDGRVNTDAVKAAQQRIAEMDMVFRILETDENGNDVVRSYGFAFDKNTHAKESAALRNPMMDGEIQPFLKSMAKITRGYASLNTRFKPFFPAITAVRDTIERVSYLPTKVYKDAEGKQISGTRIAAKTAVNAMNPYNFINLAMNIIRGESFSNYIDTQYNEFINSGANYTYNDLLKVNKDNVAKEVRFNLPVSIKNKGAAVSNKVVNAIVKWGEVFYSYPAFCQFMAMRKANIDIQDTVTGVVSLMNMQQVGTQSKNLAALYPFVNSIGQTAANVMGALGLHTATFSGQPLVFKNALKGNAMLIGMTAIYYGLIPCIRASLGDDDRTGINRLDMIPLEQLGTMVPIPIGPDGEFIKWPTGFGVSQLAATFAYGIDRVQRGLISHGDLTASLITTFAKNMIPNSAPAYEFSKDPIAYIAQTFSPMLAQPAVQVLANRSYSGARIVTDNFNPAMRKSDSGNPTTAETWKAQAKAIYDTLGIDLAPEQVRTLVNGYMTGVMQAIPAWLEQDALYKSETYQSTRDELGPIWTALGATSIYNTKMNISQKAFYEAVDYYDTRLREAGIGHLMSKSESNKPGEAEAHRRTLMAAAGFTQQEIDDVITLWNTDKELTKLNKSLRSTLDSIRSSNMNETDIRTAYGIWSDDRYETQTRAINMLNLWQYGYRRNFGIPDPEASRMLRGE